MEATETFLQRCRQLGRRRIEATRESQAQGAEVAPVPEAPSYPFEWGTCWRATMEVCVPDFEAEVGFWVDVLGFGVNAFWEERFMLISPDKEYAFTIGRAAEGETAVDPRALSLQMMLGNIEAATAALEARGVEFESRLAVEWGEENPMRTCVLRTPSGIAVKLWGFIEAQAAKND